LYSILHKISQERAKEWQLFVYKIKHSTFHIPAPKPRHLSTASLRALHWHTQLMSPRLRHGELNAAVTIRSPHPPSPIPRQSQRPRRDPLSQELSPAREVGGACFFCFTVFRFYLTFLVGVFHF
jgi:hypothetical protein